MLDATIGSYCAASLTTTALPPIKCGHADSRRYSWRGVRACLHLAGHADHQSAREVGETGGCIACRVLSGRAIKLVAVCPAPSGSTWLDALDDAAGGSGYCHAAEFRNWPPAEHCLAGTFQLFRLGHVGVGRCSGDLDFVRSIGCRGFPAWFSRHPATSLVV